MSTTPPPWQTHLYLIIQQPSQAGVLVLPVADGWTLPQVALAGRLWTPELSKVVLAIREHLALDGIVLRCAWSKSDRDTQQQHTLYIVEPRDHAWTPPAAARWIAAQEINTVVLPDPELQAEVAACFDEHGADLRAAWDQPGWFATAERWIHAQLVQLGDELIAPIEQIKSWGLSCVLRAQTTSGAVYFKVASRRALFGDEPQLMASLAVEHPDYIPAPLAIDQAQSWMLLADVGPDLRQTPERVVWQTALRRHSQLQQAFAAQPERVLAIGGVDRCLDRLALEATALLNQPELVEDLSDTERQQAESLRSQVVEMCRELANGAVPQALVHGDLHGGNIAMRDGRYLCFDWTDACFTHPFFDLVTMLEDADRNLDDGAAVVLRDAYLEQWTSYAPIERLRELWKLAEPLGSLHQVVSYVHIVESVEGAARRPLAGAITYWLQRAVQSVN